MFPKFRWWVFLGLLALGLSLAGWRVLQTRVVKNGVGGGDVSPATRSAEAQTADPATSDTRPPTSRAPLRVWSRPAAWSGQTRPQRDANGAQPRVGRAGELDRESFVPLATVVEGAELQIPVFDEHVLIGRVQRRQTEASGLTLIGGELTGARKGTFAFSDGASGFHGFLIIPSERVAFVVESRQVAGGQRIRLVEKPISEVLCSPYPTAEPEVVPSSERSGEEAGGGGSVAETVPILSSRPAATAVLYMDFDGEIVSDPHWNGGQTIQAKPAGLSAAEILEIWKRVSEDYVGFDLDITTDVRRYNTAAVGRRMRCIVTPTDIAARGAGGVAYLNSFSEAGKSFSGTIPCWVFNSGVVGAAEAISHEFGHTLGLRHDGRTSPSEEYFQGHGEGALSWAPIMGVGYYKNVVQWSKGEYTAANNQEDDIAVIASTVNGFGYSADEAGDAMETATSFAGGTLGEVGIEGVIQSSADMDLFRFDAPAGVVRLAATPAGISPNLDVRLELRDAAAQVLATANPELDLEAELEFALPASGRYYLAIVGVGHGDAASDGYSSYGSTGAYTISGEIPVGDGRPVFPTGVTVTTARTIAFTYQVRVGNTPTTYEVTGLPAGLMVDAATGVISGIPTAAEGSYTVTVTATNAVGSGTGSFVITLSAQPVPTLSGSALHLVRLSRSMELQVQATALPDTYAATGLPSGLTIDTANGLISGTPVTAGAFPVTVTATNQGGTGKLEFTLVVVDGAQRVAAGSSHALMVRADGTLWGTGWNTSGELGDGTKVIRSTPVRVAADVVSAAAGSQHSLFLKADGTVWGTGNNFQGALGDGMQNTRTVPTQIATGVIAVAAGYSHSLFLKADGTVWGAGANYSGQLGDGTTTQRLSAIQIAEDAVAVAAGGTRSFWIKSDGSLWATGGNDSGELGDGTKISRNVPTKVAEGVFSVSSSVSHTVFLKTDGTLWGMGYNGQYQLGSAHPFNCLLPVKITDGVATARAAWWATLYTTIDAKLWLIGQRYSAVHSSPLRLAEAVISFGAGSEYLLYSTADGKFWGEGSNRSRVLGDGSLFRRDVPVMAARDVTGISAGVSHSLFIKRDGSLWAFGYNGSGMLGDGTSASRSVPVPIAMDVVKPAAGNSHSLFLKSGGELWGMGLQADHRLYMRPTRVAQQVTDAAAGQGFSLWIKSDGSLWAEGQNYNGQLGDGTTTERTSPVFVTGSAAAVVAGGSHTLFRKVDGTLWSMGWNSYGQLGDGTTTDRASPVLVATGVNKAATSSYHTLIVKTDGTLWATGYNGYGQLGDGTIMTRNAPVQIASGVVDAAASGSASYYVTADDYLWAAGLGFGVSPVRIARGVKSVASIGEHVLILRQDRTLWTMGENADGQLGDGVVLFYESPVEIKFGRPAVDAVTLPFEANLGDVVAFSVTASGEGALSYQWRRDGLAIEGATDPDFLLNHAQGADGGVYDVVITNTVGSVISGAGSLTILGAPPKIVSASTWSAARFDSGSFRIEATNEPTSFTASGLPEGLTLDPENGWIAGIPTASAGIYEVTIGAANAHGSATGSLAITLLSARAPTISSSQTAVARRNAAFRMQVTASGSPQSYGATGLPAGLLVNAATGLISGLPTAQPGIYSASLTATNEGGTAVLPVKFAVMPEGQDRAAGYQSTFFIDDEGILWSAGSNDFGQLGDGTTMHRSVPVPIAEDVVAVATSPANSLFVKMDGTLWGMGWNVEGLLGFGDTRERHTPELIRRDVIAVAIGFGHSVFLKSDGTAWTVGRNGSGQLGDGSQQSRLHPVMVASDVAAVGAAADSTYFVKLDGTLWATGSNFDGELGDGTFETRFSPGLVSSDVSAVQGGLSLALFRKTDATLWGMGFNGGNQLRTREPGEDYAQPTPVKLADGVASFSAGANQVLYLTSSGALWGRGLNWWGQLGDRTKLYETAPRQIATSVAFAFTGFNHSVYRTTDGSLWAVGTSVAGELADGFDALETIPVKVAENVSRSAAGDAHSLFLTDRGELWSVGYNSLGSLGDGTNVDRGQPVKIAEGVADVATSYWHSVFVKQDGSLWAMGNNGDGQLGTGGINPNGINRPRRVMDDVKAAVTGVWHTVALKKDGTVWTIGWNGQGQLGDGTNLQRTTPVKVISGVSEVAAGAKHTLFLKTDGTLWVTGDNEAGQLGDGTTTGRNAPVQVMTGVAHIAAGGWHSLFLKTDGTLWGTGYNQFGQLGDGTSTNRSAPVLVDSNVRSMAAGTYHTQYIKEDGTLWVVGLNDSGQLGDGVAAERMEDANAAGSSAAGSNVSGVSRGVTLEAGRVALGSAPADLRTQVRLTAAVTAQTPAEASHLVVGVTPGAYQQTEKPQTRYRPVRVATGVSHVAGGGYHSLYVKHDGSLWAMGQAMYGRLGNGAGLVQWEPKEIKFGPPAIRSQSIPYAVRLGQVVEFSIEAAGIGPFTYQWRKDRQSIPGATSSQWLLNGAVSADGGVYDVVVSNEFGSRTCAAVNVTVIDGAPVIRSSLSVDVPRLSEDFEFYLRANNDTTSYSAAGLPSGLTLDASTGRISGRIEAAVGPLSVTITATNASGSTTATLTINVTPQAAPVITSATTLLARHGQRVNYTIRASNSPTEFSAVDLPTGLTVDPATGVVSGEVSAAPGDYAASISATNSSGAGSAELTVIVLPIWAGIAAGQDHSLAVDDEGRVWSMGSNLNGQTGGLFRISNSAPQQMAENVVAVGASSSASVLLKADGTLWAAGYITDSDADGSLGNMVQLASRVRAFAVGNFHVLFVDWDGKLWSRGANWSGQLGDGTTDARQGAVFVASEVAAVAAGGEFSLFVKRDGSLWGMGRNAEGQLGDGTTTNRPHPVRIADDVRSAAGGYFHALIVKRDGSLWATGEGRLGGFAEWNAAARLKPELVHSGVVAAWAYSGTTFLTDDGKLWAAGSAPGSSAGSVLPTLIASGVAGGSCGGNHLLLIDTAGRIMSMGENTSGQLGESPMAAGHYIRIANDVVSVAGAYGHTMFAKQDGSLWGMGEFGSGQRGAHVETFNMQPVADVHAVDGVGVAGAFTLFVRTDRTLWGMGWNGQQMESGGVSTSTAVKIATNVSAVTGSNGPILFVTTDGALWGMGSNYYGQLGDGSRTDRAVPVKILDGVQSATSGGGHTLILKTDGSLWGAGANDRGQLGSGPANSATPIQLATDVVSMAAGNYHTLYVTRAGTLWAMGDNDSGQLGDGTIQPRITPVQVASGVQSVSAGGESSFFIKTDGSLWTMGANTYGQLGDGTRQNRLLPVLVATGVQTVSSADGATFIIKKDRSLWGTGSNERSRLGLPIVASRKEPREIVFDAPVVESLSIPVAANLGGTGQFSVTASGMGALTYQWRNNGVPIPGATGVGYFIGVVTASDGGIYDVVVTGPRGSTVSEASSFAVLNAPPVITSPLSATAGRGIFEYRVTANNDARVFRASGLPQGLVLDEATGRISGTIEASAGTYAVSLSIGNDHGTVQTVLELVVSGDLPAITLQPADVIVPSGHAASFTVAVRGDPAPAVRWQVSTDGSTWSDVSDSSLYQGAATTTLSIAQATPMVNRCRYRAIATNSHGSAVSAAAMLTVISSPFHFVSGENGYTPGDRVSIANYFYYDRAPTELSWQMLLPDGWSFVSSTIDTLADEGPSAGTTGSLEWTLSTLPPSPVTFTYVLAVPANSTGPKEIAAIGGIKFGDSRFQLLATPDPLIIEERKSYHSADTNRDWKLGLLELARVIELYNTRSGGSRSGAYAVLDGSEDGFAPEPARALNASAALARYHSADTDRNGRLSLLELARVIELYNQRTSGVRAGRYKVQSGSEDGYAVEP